MDFTSFIEIIIAILVAYFILKFIVSPVLKIIFGIIIILVLLYLLQRFFGFNIDKALAPLGVSLNLNKWGDGFNWILSPINYCLDQIKKFLDPLWNNLPKFSKP
jgi:uncharacterized membrane protein YfcA